MQFSPQYAIMKKIIREVRHAQPTPVGSRGGRVAGVDVDGMLVPRLRIDLGRREGVGAAVGHVQAGQAGHQRDARAGVRIRVVVGVRVVLEFD